MNLSEYQHCLTQVPFGKRLPTALYVFWEDGVKLGGVLDVLLKEWREQYEVPNEFNVIKFRTNELKVSFLHYPGFFSDPHPSLQQAITIDLVTGKIRRINYEDNSNPPILHRKESFLSIEHRMYEKFRALTEAEEAADLYKDTATIGFKLNWDRLLAGKGLSIREHQLQYGEVRIEESKAAEASVPAVDRHKTALMRYELSKPVKTLLEYGMLKPETTFFDYGCGQGSDVRGLVALGHQAVGWDPVHRLDGEKCEADIVNMGYVLNVIEDPAERLESLVDAHRHCRKLLVVSGLINETVDTARARQFPHARSTELSSSQLNSISEKSRSIENQRLDLAPGSHLNSPSTGLLMQNKDPKLEIKIRNLKQTPEKLIGCSCALKMNS